MSDADIENIVLNILERWHRGRFVERHGLVTAYDPDNHLGKVMLQPEGFETGWLPIERPHIGETYGIAIGLQPGDGKTTGDQVTVRYQEGDVESGKISGMVYSDVDKPPKVQSGEMLIYTRFQKSGGGPESAQSAQGGTGQQLYFKNDGSVLLTDGNGGSISFDGNGNRTDKHKNHTITGTGDRSLTIQGQDTVNISKNLSKTVGGKRTDSVSGSWMTKAASGLWGWLNIGGSDDDG